MTYYRVSALAYGLARMWRGWAVLVPVVLANALLQAVLVWPDATPMIDTSAIVLAALSGLVLLIAYTLVAATALHVAEGHVGWSLAVATVRRHAARFTVWALALGLVTWVGLALFTVPGLIVVGGTPFVLLAVLDGQANPLAANFRTIGRRFWRWLVTAIVTTLVLVVGSLLSGFFTFFTRASLAAFVVWLVGGLIIAWFTTAWALVYRNAAVSPDVLEGRGSAT